MTDIVCGYRGDRDETLVAYLYDDINAIERARFEAHLVACERCRGEVDELRAVRVQLSRWSPPVPRLATLDSARESRIPNPKSRFSWRDIPAWAQVAAALLFLGVSVGVANLNVRYDRDGLYHMRRRMGMLFQNGAFTPMNDRSPMLTCPEMTTCEAMKQ